MYQKEKGPAILTPHMWLHITFSCNTPFSYDGASMCATIFVDLAQVVVANGGFVASTNTGLLPNLSLEQEPQLKLQKLQ